MNVLRDVFQEITSMFLGDARLSVAILSVVAIAAGLIEIAGLDPLLAGAILLAGCLAVLLEAVRRRAREG
ncbi:hypothetical protein [Oceanibaculum nanhaiense]|uniref:hypothetical protein n=1 Tax=Oceanibaculum nanhaiense TaxID=1909734 RepID=UPI00396D8BFD